MVVEEDALIGLARHAVRGDDDAITALLEELRPLIVRSVRLIVGVGRAVAEDAAQEALIDVYRGIRDLRDPNSVRAWALRIASRRALRAVRRERLRDLIFEPVAVSVPWVDDSLARDIAGAFALLPPRMRAVTVLRLLVGLNEVETARALGCATGTVKSQLSEARERLQSTLRLGG